MQYWFFLEVGVQLGDFFHAIPVDFPTFFAQRFAKGLPHIHRIDQLHLSSAVRALVAGQNEDINADVGVIEKLGRQGNNGLNQIFLQHPAPDLALTAGGSAREKRRAIGNDRCTPVFLVQLVDGVLHEQQLGVAGSRQTMLKPSALLVFLTDVLLLSFRCIFASPGCTKRRIHNHQPHFLIREAVRFQGVGLLITHDVFHILPFDEHICQANGVGFGVDFLSKQAHIHIGIFAAQENHR